jgi:hypothetical protein
MWKANGKPITLLLFLDSLFPKTETYARCFLWRQDTLELNYSPHSDLWGGVGGSRKNIMQHAFQEEGL